MIRLLEESDREEAVALLRGAPAFNLYALGNIETHGFVADFCQFWGDFNNQGVLQAVLNRYMTGWVIYGLHGADWMGLGAVIDAHPTPAERLQDNPGGVDSLLPYLSRYRARKAEDDELAALDPAFFQPIAAREGIHVRRATLADLPELIAFYADAEEMSRVPAAVERPLRERRVWVAVVDSRIKSAALTNAETSKLAMIGGVYTKKETRGQKLSQFVISAICADLIAIGKQPILYWHNPVAGIVYHKVGFQPIGRWRSVRLEKLG
jgi:predicted GNAT family acetyltransferase